MTISDKIKLSIIDALQKFYINEVDFVIEHPDDLKNGDYSTNVALVCAKKLGKNPRELADKIKHHFEKDLPKEISKIETAGAGFINFYLAKEFFKDSIEEIVNNPEGFGKNVLLEGKKIMVEYTDPNPFKPFHIGHLMTNTIGESISRILEHSGAEVSRANYQGDVGLHVARAIWGLEKNKKLQNKTLSISEQSRNIGKAYSLGAEAYENDPKAKEEIDAINKKVYNKSDKEVNEIYDWGFKATMEAFEDLYKILGTKFDYYFLESQMAPIGEKIVKENKSHIFEESDGAIVFKAEKHDPKLHTRVFITSTGLPTYETKELGLTDEKFKTLPNLDLSIVVTANEQADYMKVVAKAISLIHPENALKMKHVTHGMMQLTTGKMSSRKGNVVTGESLILDTIALVKEKLKDRDLDGDKKEQIGKDVGVAAVKYSILKQSTGGNILYDFDKSISFEGDSGPYLQYSYARASSVIEKAARENILPDFKVELEEVSEVEKLLYRFPEIVSRASMEYEPHYIANYLIDLARSFNSFYGNNLIVDKEGNTSPYKVALTFAFSFVMKKGLRLLGIEAPKEM